MDNVELVKKLREISRSGSTFRRMICKMAAQHIERQDALLAAVLADLRKADVDCSFCVNKETPVPCAEDEEDYPMCKGCPYECNCKECFDNSKWEYYGLQLAVSGGLPRRCAPRNDKEEGSMYLCKDCDHLMVCKYTDAGDGRCQKPQYFRDKQAVAAVINISPDTRKAMERMGSKAHGGGGR